MSKSVPVLRDVTGFRRYGAPGDCLEAQGARERGTIGVFGIDTASRGVAAITAMHVFLGVTEYPSPRHPESLTVECPCAGGSGNVYGTLLRGTMTDVDCAAILLAPDVPAPSSFLPGIGEITHWRSLSGSDANIEVRMVGAASSGVQTGTILEPIVDVPSWNLKHAIQAQIPALHGDSGSPLVDRDGFLIGILVGGDATVQLFSPIDLVFDRLQCSLY